VTLRFALALPVDGPAPARELHGQAAIRRMATAIEAAGFDACSVTDHPFPPRDWLDAGGHHSMDPLVALACAGTATTRLRLFTNCYIPAYRHPYVAAKGIATLDAMTDGRVILGLAAGYLEGEFAALDVPFDGRGRRLDRAIAQMKEAWTGRDTPAGNAALPVPACRPHPPIWIGGNSRTAMRRAVEAGDGWIPFAAPPRLAETVRTRPLRDHDDLAERLAELREMAAAAGRDRPLDVCFTPLSHPHWREACDPGALVEEARLLAALGVTWLSFHLPAPSVDEFCDNVARIGEEAIAPVRQG
jgi:probable F420-dependent oxidoreductase